MGLLGEYLNSRREQNRQRADQEFRMRALKAESLGKIIASDEVTPDERDGLMRELMRVTGDKPARYDKSPLKSLLRVMHVIGQPAKTHPDEPDMVMPSQTFSDGAGSVALPETRVPSRAGVSASTMPQTRSPIDAALSLRTPGSEQIAGQLPEAARPLEAAPTVQQPQLSPTNDAMQERPRRATVPTRETAPGDANPSAYLPSRDDFGNDMQRAAQVLGIASMPPGQLTRVQRKAQRELAAKFGLERMQAGIKQQERAATNDDKFMFAELQHDRDLEKLRVTGFKEVGRVFDPATRTFSMQYFNPGAAPGEQVRLVGIEGTPAEVEAATLAGARAIALPLEQLAMQIAAARNIPVAQARTLAGKELATAHTLRNRQLETNTTATGARLRESQAKGLSADANRVFNFKTKGLFEQLRVIGTQIESYNTRAAKAEIRPETARERTAELEAQAGVLRAQIEAARTEAISSASAARRGVPSRPSPVGGAYAGKRFSRSNLEAMRESFGGKSTQEIERIITQNGGTVY